MLLSRRNGRRDRAGLPPHGVSTPRSASTASHTQRPSDRPAGSVAGRTPSPGGCSHERNSASARTAGSISLAGGRAAAAPAAAAMSAADVTLPASACRKSSSRSAPSICPARREHERPAVRGSRHDGEPSDGGRSRRRCHDGRRIGERHVSSDRRNRVEHPRAIDRLRGLHSAGVRATGEHDRDRTIRAPLPFAVYLTRGRDRRVGATLFRRSREEPQRRDGLRGRGCVTGNRNRHEPNAGVCRHAFEVGALIAAGWKSEMTTSSVRPDCVPSHASAPGRPRPATSRRSCGSPSLRRQQRRPPGARARPRVRRLVRGLPSEAASVASAQRRIGPCSRSCRRRSPARACRRRRARAMA